ncbi:hypothetical protein WA171_007274 [Blastocystis sp. BT1]
MNGMWTRYQKLVEQYTIATRLEMNQKYGIAVTAYYNFVCTGLLFAEEYRNELPPTHYESMKSCLKDANQRMERLKQQGYEPMIESPKVTIQEPAPALPLRPTCSSNKKAPPAPLPPKPPKVAPGETVVSVEVTGKPMDVVYDLNDPYEKNVVETILDSSPSVKWEDIAGMKYAKKVLYETVILPSKRPDLFTGLRAPPKGILLFGPPGTGKTMLGKAVATESNALFFSISSSSLTSKWVGESEKIVRALFKVAYKNQPSIIFIDEIDSILTARSENENEASRRLKTEFLIQLDGAATNGEERVLIMGATNRPFELDDAVIRRMARRVYIPLPDKRTRFELFKILLKKQKCDLSKEDMQKILDMSNMYSGSDIKVLCKEAAMGPIREIDDLMSVENSKIRPIQLKDFIEAFKVCTPSVNPNSLKQYISWNESFGSKGEDTEGGDDVDISSISSEQSKCKSY